MCRENKHRLIANPYTRKGRSVFPVRCTRCCFSHLRTPTNGRTVSRWSLPSSAAARRMERPEVRGMGSCRAEEDEGRRCLAEMVHLLGQQQMLPASAPPNQKTLTNALAPTPSCFAVWTHRMTLNIPQLCWNIWWRFARDILGGHTWP